MSKKSFGRKAVLATTLAAGMLTAGVAPAEATSSPQERAGAVMRSHANIKPRAVAAILRLCQARPANCSLRPYTDGTYGVRVVDVPEPYNRAYEIEAGYRATYDGNVLGFDVAAKYAGSILRSGQVGQPELICEDTDMAGICTGSIYSGQLSPLNVSGTFQGLAISAAPIGGNVRTSRGNVRPFIEHPAAAEFLGAFAVDRLETASRAI